MQTDPADAAAIEASLELASENAGDLTERVYALLFGRQPEMEALFWRDKSNLIKGEMLAKVFDAIFDFIGPRKYADHLIATEVHTHAGYDVPPRVFATFFGVVAEVVQEACGTGWTDTMDGAWRRLLKDLDDYVVHPDRAAAA
jgi:hemoglobin-like flavoprotein